MAKKFSKTVQKNLWKSLTQERKYARELRRLINKIGSKLKDILTKLTTFDAITGITTLDLSRFVDEMDTYISAEVKTTGDTITRDAAKAGMDLGIKYADVDIALAQGLKVDYTKASAIYTAADWRVLDALKVRNLSALKGITDDMSKTIVRELSDGIQAGEGIPKLSKRIQEAANISKTRATTIARTETINACTNATILRYKQAGFKRFRFIAAYDERTCETCGAYHNHIYDIDDIEHQPPIHPNCRCAVAAVYDDE